VGLNIADCQLPIANWIACIEPIGNWKSAIGNVRAHALPRSRTDLIDSNVESRRRSFHQQTESDIVGPQQQY